MNTSKLFHFLTFLTGQGDICKVLLDGLGPLLGLGVFQGRGGSLWLELVEEPGPQEEDGDGAQRGGDEDGEDGQGQDLPAHGLPLHLAALPGHVEEDRPNRRLHRGLRQPGEGHEDLLLGVEDAAGDGDDDADHAEEQRPEEDDEAATRGVQLDLVHLHLGADQGEEDRLEDDPHLAEGVGDGVVVGPALLPPLDGRGEGHDDGGEAAGAVVVHEVGAVTGDHPAAEHDSPPVGVVRPGAASVKGEQKGQ